MLRDIRLSKDHAVDEQSLEEDAVKNAKLVSLLLFLFFSNSEFRFIPLEFLVMNEKIA